MTTRENVKHFTHTLLPWIIAGASVLIFLFTLNHWVSLSSLPVMSKIGGWDWQPARTHPLFFALTWPLRLLPGSVQFIALNAFSAICAGLALALLARSVALLPHDRTREQRQREESEDSTLSIRLNWVPPLFAALVFSFQLTFWEHATAVSTDMFDLLIFAYLVRCLLEYRRDRNESWLTKLALVYGVGVTNNWALIGFLPLFVAALVWMKGMRFFRLPFLLRMIGFGAVGLLFYFLLPLTEVFSSRPGSGFIPALLDNWRHQKAFLTLPFKTMPVLRAHLFMISLTSLLPLLIIGIRWPSFHGDVNPAAAALTGFMFRALHLMFLVVCTWVFFDPKFSPRNLGFGLLPFLSFYYIAALVVGYFAGYALLVFGTRSDRSWERSKGVASLLNGAVAAIVLLGLAVAPVAILYRNLPAIRSTNGPILHNFAVAMSDALPRNGAVTLSEDATRLHLVEAVHHRRGTKHNHLLVDTKGFTNPEYVSQLKIRAPYGESIVLPEEKAKALEPLQVVEILKQLSSKHPIYYLHPSFGYYFEFFYAIPHGVVYELAAYKPDELVPPAFSSELVAENETFWNQKKTAQFPAIANASKNSAEAGAVAGYYGRSLNTWGALMQRMKRLEEAKGHFEAALKIHPENIAADINLQFNEQLRSGTIAAVQSNKELERKLTQYRSWEAAMMLNGLFDELEINMQVGQLFAQGSNYRQACFNFFRVLELTPNSLPAQVAVAKTYIDLQQPSKALEIITKVRNQPKDEPFTPEQQFELLSLEAMSYINNGDLDVAEEVLLSARAESPKNEKITGLLTEFYLQSAVVHMRNQEWEKAIQRLNLLLKVDPKHPYGLLNRAIAYLQLDHLEQSKADYEKLEQTLPDKLFRIYYGLGEIARRQKNAAEALRNYKLYLEYAPQETDEYKQVTQIVQQLESGGR